MQSGGTPFEVCELQSCEEHPGKTVEFYCLDYSQPCCTSCTTLSHRKCENVISIQKAASGIKQSTKASNLSQKQREHVIQLGEIIDDRNKNLADHKDRIEETLKDELTSSKKQVNITLKDEVDILSSYRSTFKNWKAVIDNDLEHGSELQCLLEINKIEPKISDLEREMVDLAKNIKVDESPNHTLIDKLGITKVDFHTGQINILQVIDVCNGERTTSRIFIGTYLLFTIRQKQKVVKYNCDGNSLLSELALPSKPEDIGEMTQFKIAISSYKFGVYIVDTDKITLLQSLSLPKIQVYGLCVFNKDQLIISDSKTLTWINFPSGEKVNQRSTLGESIFSSLEQEGYIYGEDDNSVNSVIGNMTKFTYTNDQLSTPRGIGIDLVGNIYIAGCCSKNIHQLTNEGKLIRIIPATTFELRLRGQYVLQEEVINFSLLVCILVRQQYVKLFDLSSSTFYLSIL
ncbi:unnamed protein product [Mytilus coruscus]|uniref:B box-type domain-containing protein n=1 Tax=Mytilus coruscus TaxID=42192 RepID=A0A6J8CGZ4_MYTCO|nr:unnamed protein product [Mytilus coruscus]